MKNSSLLHAGEKNITKLYFEIWGIFNSLRGHYTMVDTPALKVPALWRKRNKHIVNSSLNPQCYNRHPNQKSWLLHGRLWAKMVRFFGFSQVVQPSGPLLGHHSQ